MVADEVYIRAFCPQASAGCRITGSTLSKVACASAITLATKEVSQPAGADFAACNVGSHARTSANYCNVNDDTVLKEISCAEAGLTLKLDLARLKPSVLSLRIRINNNP